jgi:hypothetical protein
MDHRTRSCYRPQIDVLEDRTLPSALGSLGNVLADSAGLMASPSHHLVRRTDAAPAPNFFVIPPQSPPGAAD